MTGVTVSIKGKPISTITDENGQFTISAAEGDVLVFSFIGYTTLSMTITMANFNGNALNITMKEDAIIKALQTMIPFEEIGNL